MRKKVTVVGSGNVGASTAMRIADRELADVVMTDILEGIPQGKGLDLLQAGPIVASDSQVKGTNDYKDTAGSDIVVVTARSDRHRGGNSARQGTRLASGRPDCGFGFSSEGHQ